MSSTVSDILISLARNTFPNDTVVAVLPVKKTEHKKVVRPALFFVLAKSRSRLSDVRVHLVKRGDKGDSFKRKRAWNLSDVRKFDGCSNGDLDVEVTFSDGKKRWTCFSHRDKQEFAKKLLDTVRQLRNCHTKFENFPNSLFTTKPVARQRTDDSLLMRTFGDDSRSAEDPMAGFEVLSEVEARDLQAFLDDNNESVQNAENFVKKLNEELRDLEVSNIHALISSGPQVSRLTRLIESGVAEVDKLESRVSEYGARLEGTSASLSVLADRDKLAKLSAANQRRVAQRLARLVADIKFEEADRQLLRSPNFANAADLPKLHAAALRCDAILHADIPNDLKAMEAVQKSFSEVTELKKVFSSALVRHFNNTFIAYQSHRRSGTRQREFSFPSHAENKRELLRFSSLMAWLKANYRDQFSELKGRYSNLLAKVYDSECKEVLEAARSVLLPHSKDRSRPATLRHAGSNSSLNRDSFRRGGANEEAAASPAAGGASGASLDSVFSRLLDALEPVVDAEEDFCLEFFDVAQNPDPQDAALRSISGVSDDSVSLESSDSARVSAAVKQELDELLKVIFGPLFAFLNDLVSSCHAASAEFSMTMLVMAAERSDRQSARPRFLGHVYAHLCLRAKQTFDQHVLSMIQAFKDFKPNRKARCGIIACIKSYDEFSGRAASVFKDSRRLPDLERAHQKLIEALVALVERVAQEHGKTPAAVVLMENCHRLESIVRSQRMHQLDPLRRELNDRFKQNRTEYVKACLGRPLEKLSEFFDGVEHSLARGVRAEEVGYQMQYSRNELKKLIREYPAKDVKRRLEQLRKKVEKDLCEEENLFVVVWHEMQQAFLAQYNQFNSLIAQCYPNANLSLEFSDSDLLRFFREIADRSGQ